MAYLNLDTKKTETTVEELNVLLADYHVYYQELRNFHWNVEGTNFFDLHEQFEDMYDDAKEKIDAIAERILTLRYSPDSSLATYLEKSNITESPKGFDDRKMVDTLLEDHQTIIQQMRQVVNAADEANDEGTVDLIGGYIRELEKTDWMLDTWTKKIKN